MLALVGALRASGRVLYWALRETCYQLAKGKAEVRGGAPRCAHDGARPSAPTNEKVGGQTKRKQRVLGASLAAARRRLARGCRVRRTERAGAGMQGRLCCKSG